MKKFCGREEEFFYEREDEEIDIVIERGKEC